MDLSRNCELDLSTIKARRRKYRKLAKPMRAAGRDPDSVDLSDIFIDSTIARLHLPTEHSHLVLPDAGAFVAFQVVARPSFTSEALRRREGRMKKSARRRLRAMLRLDFNVGRMWLGN